jgi:hypothetical protein
MRKLRSDKIFADKLLIQVNILRTNPYKFADNIDNMTKDIQPNEDINKNMSSIPYLFINPASKEKIGLLHGESAFKKVASVLRTLKPLPELQWTDDIIIEMKDFQCIDKHEIEKLVLQKEEEVKEKYPNFIVFYDAIKDAELSAILQVVDDNTFKGQRRDALLSEKFKYFAVSRQTDKNIKFFNLISFA